MTSTPNIVIENGVSVRELITTGSVLEIDNIFYDDFEDYSDLETHINADAFGAPVQSFSAIESSFVVIDEQGYVKKKILQEGGGSTLDEGCTVSISYSGYFENESTFFDMIPIHKPLIVDMKDNGLLPGLQTAVKSMLVGELSMFLLSYTVMYGIMGVPPKIKPRANCVYYIKMVKSILTPKDGQIKFSEPNMFGRVQKEVRSLYLTGVQLYNANNCLAAIQLFKKSIGMLHRCRLADEREQNLQEKLLIKLYMNLAVCYNKTKQPLRACTACNEIKNICNIWNNGKALFQNAKALRMIGEFDQAMKKLERALELWPDSNEMLAEMVLLTKARDSFRNTKITVNQETDVNNISDEFKLNIDNLIKTFKNEVNICKFTLPSALNKHEVAYIKEVCKTYNVFCNKVQKSIALNKEDYGPVTGPAEVMKP